MSFADSTGDGSRSQTAAGTCCEPTTWLARLHSRAVERIPDASARCLLQQCWLRLTDAGGWPSWSLAVADDLKLSHDVLKAYRLALEATICEAVASLTVVTPTPDAQLEVIWGQALARLELSSTRMLLRQQAKLVAIDDLVARVKVGSTWIAMVESRFPQLEEALSQTIGRAVTVVLEPEVRA